MLGCLAILTTGLVLFFVLGLIFRRPDPYVVPTTGRELRVAEAAVPIYFTPGSPDRVVARVRPGGVVWVRRYDQSAWVAVFEEEQSRLVLGFSPDSAFTRAAAFPSAPVGAPVPSWRERLEVRFGGGAPPRR